MWRSTDLELDWIIYLNHETHEAKLTTAAINFLLFTLPRKHLLGILKKNLYGQRLDKLNRLSIAV